MASLGSRITRLVLVLPLVATLLAMIDQPVVGAITREEVENAIKHGVHYLKDQQRAGDGSWSDVDKDAHTGTTSLVTLALLTAGEPANSPTITRALDYLRRFTPEQLRSTYAVALQTMVFAAATPERDQLKIAANVAWLERAQIKAGDKVAWPGSWTYSDFKERPGDNSNTQYALLGLNSAVEVGVPVKPEVWTLSRVTTGNGYRHNDGSWGYTPDSNAPPTASMTCAGISSLIITGLKRFQGQEFLNGNQVQNCGLGGENVHIRKATDWLAKNFRVGENYGNGQQWKYYYLYGMERMPADSTASGSSASMTGTAKGPKSLIHNQDRLDGFWQGALFESSELVSTSFCPPFSLAKGRMPRS